MRSTLSFARLEEKLQMPRNDDGADYKLVCLGIYWLAWATHLSRCGTATRHFCEGFTLDFEKVFNYAPHVDQK